MLTKVNGKKMYEEVARQIRKKIASGEYKHGDMLPAENDLAKQAAVSRVTVREALRLLSEMGLIERRHGVGSFVTVDIKQENLDNKVHVYFGEYKNDLEQALKIKRIIDPSIAREAAHKATDHAIAKLEQAMENINQNKQNNQAYDQACSEFHLAIVGMLQLPLLTEIYEHLEKMENTNSRFSSITPNNLPEIKEKDIEQHRKILWSLKNHLPDYAYFYTIEHLDYIAECYEQYFSLFY